MLLEIENSQVHQAVGIIYKKDTELSKYFQRIHSDTFKLSLRKNPSILVAIENQRSKNDIRTLNRFINFSH